MKSKLQEGLDVIDKMGRMQRVPSTQPPSELKTLAHDMFVTITQKLSPHVPSMEMTRWGEAYILDKLEQVAEDNQTHEM